MENPKINLVLVTAQNLDRFFEIAVNGRPERILLAHSQKEFWRGIPLPYLMHGPFQKMVFIGAVLQGICDVTGQAMYLMLDQNTGFPMYKTATDDQHQLRGWRAIIKDGRPLKLYIPAQ